MVEKKRILLLCQHFYPEMVSTGMHMTELSEALSKKDIEITVFCAPPVYEMENWEGVIPEYIEHRGIKIYRAKTIGRHESGLINRLLFALSYLLQALVFTWKKKETFDGIIVGTNPPFLGIVTMILRKLFGEKYILIVYDVYPEYAVTLGVIDKKSFITKIWRWITERIINNAAAIVVIGRDMKKIIEQKLDEKYSAAEKIQMIPNWSDENTVKPISEKHNDFRDQLEIGDEFLVLYSGTMNKSHNLEPLLEAAELLDEEPFHFVFVGQGSNKRNLQNIAIEKGLKNVQFLPFQPKKKLPEVLAACDISVVCLNSQFTGISVPSKTYGIMAAGRPILAFVEEGSEIGLTVTESKCGIVMEEPNGQTIAKKIKELKKDDGLLRSMSENSYNSFINNYTLASSSDKYYQLIYKIF